MADSVTETEKLTPPLGPGVDHQKHIEATRAEIATAVGLKPEDVIPKEEKAEELAKANIGSFLEGVAHAPEDQAPAAAGNQESALDNLKEVFNAFMPGDENTVRVMPTGEASNLKKESLAKMGVKEEQVS